MLDARILKLEEEKSTAQSCTASRVLCVAQSRDVRRPCGRFIGKRLAETGCPLGHQGTAPQHAAHISVPYRCGLPCRFVNSHQRRYWVRPLAFIGCDVHCSAAFGSRIHRLHPTCSSANMGASIWEHQIGKIATLIFQAVALLTATIFSRNLVADAIGLPPQDFDLTVAFFALIFIYRPAPCSSALVSWFYVRV